MILEKSTQIYYKLVSFLAQVKAIYQFIKQGPKKRKNLLIIELKGNLKHLSAYKLTDIILL